MKINFYDELVKALSEHGKTLDDVIWIGTRKNQFVTSKFLQWAKSFYYDNGYGMPCIPMSWCIVGDNWWLERYEYDGSEWWEFKQFPKRPLFVAEDFLNVEDE